MYIDYCDCMCIPTVMKSEFPLDSEKRRQELRVGTRNVVTRNHKLREILWSTLSQRWIILCMTTRIKLPRCSMVFCSSDNCSLYGESYKETFLDVNKCVCKLMICYDAQMFACDQFKLYVAILSFGGLPIVALCFQATTN